MSQSEENMFEKQWRNAFDDAAETPPLRVWDTIERHLDQDEREAAVIPFWTRFRPFAYGAAAAVALLLMGWWAFRYTDRPGEDTAVASRPEAAVRPRAADEQLASARQESNLRQKAAAGTVSPEAANKPLVQPRASAGEELASRVPDKLNRSLAPAGKEPASSPESFTPSDAVAVLSSPEATKESGPTPFAARKAGNTRLQAGDPSASSLPASLPENTGALLAETGAGRETATYERLNGKPLSLRSRSGISRVVWFRMPDEVTAPQIDRKSRNKEYWTAVTVMPMSFNPSASVRLSGISPAFSAGPATLTNQVVNSPPTIQNRSKLSMALNWNTGIKVSNHWSVETGVNYLQGNATAESNAVVLTAMSSTADNLLENAVRNSASYSSDKAFAGVTNSNHYYAGSASSSVVANDFKFIQVPVQAGYHIRPDAKLSYALLGGVLANVFLSNTVGTIEVSPGDEIYRPVTLSGTAGLRVSYRPTRHWSGSLTGSYQQALQTGTRPEAQVQTRPQAMGVGLGMNYHF